MQTNGPLMLLKRNKSTEHMMKLRNLHPLVHEPKTNIFNQAEKLPQQGRKSRDLLAIDHENSVWIFNKMEDRSKPIIEEEIRKLHKKKIYWGIKYHKTSLAIEVSYAWYL